ncbi:LOW QUALITY PROTEIN: hypothetical protein Cgig2_023437 [Carnegiea gigantea]|uniref:Uncharacterized protein n=1 Tax=Carnegiea gigantea TaxID=171969 RepID=A0A9Q1GLW0_9CARY|nr:LOW QUALITY PROTEIN: hypothetical protein Cgig2_023437 [Carnegiea gigantea]
MTALASAFASVSSSWHCVQISLELFPMSLVPSNKPLKSSKFYCSSQPQGECLGHCYFLFGDLRGSEASGVIKSQDLTRSWTSDNLAVESALMKLVDGHWRGQLISKGQGCDPQLTGFLIAEGQTVWLSLPPSAKGRMPRPHSDSPQSVVVFEMLMAGFFPCGMREGACGKNDLVKCKDYEKGGTNKFINCTFLACWVTRCCLSSSRWRSVSAATCSGVASPVSKIVNLVLACSA